MAEKLKEVRFGSCYIRITSTKAHKHSGLGLRLGLCGVDAIKDNILHDTGCILPSAPMPFIRLYAGFLVHHRKPHYVVKESKPRANLVWAIMLAAILGCEEHGTETRLSVFISKTEFRGSSYFGRAYCTWYVLKQCCRELQPLSPLNAGTRRK